jgi:two-component system sensor histidine kinase KdpD
MERRDERKRRRWQTFVLWIAVLAGVTVLMLPARGALSDAPVALAYLLSVLFAGAKGGRALALTMAGLAFLAFNFVFLVPYGTLALANPLHWLVLLAFLVASVVATRLFERSRDEAVLEESLRARDAVMASLSHDLRAPLTSIKALAHDLAASGDARAVTIEQEADRLHEMVTDVLDLARLSSGTLRLNIEVNDAEDLVGTALQRMGASWPGREVAVQIKESEAAPLFGRFDYAHTLRVVVNLLDNALKYSPSDSTVDLVVSRDARMLSFAVCDRGDGVPVGERERIFEPFYRPPGEAPDVHGAGLGLAIARRLAEAQGGTLSHAPRPGGGSIFTLHVPAADVSHSAQGAAGQG